MKILARSFCVGISIVFFVASQAQPSQGKFDYNQAVSFPSPNAASLGKFGFIPMNYSSGTPGVSVPIYSIQEKDLSFDLSLTYNSNGLRVAEEASWAGFGWTLMATGAITRVIHGLPDLEGSVYLNNNNGKKWDDIGGLPYIDDLTANRIAEGYYDGEPDMFSFNFGKYSGKFILYRGEVVPLSYQNMSIKKVSNDFFITTDDGVIYAFSKRETTTFHDARQAYSFPTYVSSWLLTSITSANGVDRIDFLYASEQEVIESATSFGVDHTFMGNPPPYGNGVNDGYLCVDKRSNVSNSGSSVVASWRLAKIVSRTAEIVFVPSEVDRLDLYGSSKALSEVQIFSRETQSLIRKYKFDCDYFGDTSSQNTCRLRLNSVLETGVDGKLVRPYYFKYYDGTLPSKLSFGQDHWGYSNGVGNESLIPHIFDWQNFGDAIRIPDFGAERVAMLERIIYPTKGFTKFTYELNTYTTTSGDAPGPGLRVRQMEDFDGKRTIVKTFAYANPVFFGQPLYGEFHSASACACIIVNPDPIYGCIPLEVECGLYTITGQNASLYAGLSNFALAYKNVTERIGAGGVGGSTQYIYEVGNQFFLDRDIRLTETISKNSSDQMVKYLKNDYVTVSDTVFNAFTPKLTGTHMECQSLPKPRDPLYGYILSDYEIEVMYPINSYWVSLVKTTEVDFDTKGVETVRNESSYYYDATPVHRYVTRIEQPQSDGKINIRFLKYPQDFSTDADFGGDSYYNGLKKLVELHRYDAVVEYQQITRDKGTDYVTDAKVLLFKAYVSDNNIQISEVHTLESDVQLTPTNSYTAGGVFHFDNLPYRKLMSYDYDAYGNVTSRATRAEVVSYIWGYDGTLPIVQVKGINSADLVSAYNAVNGDLSDLRIHPNLVHLPLVSYTYVPLVGVATIVDANGQRITYSYDELGRLIAVYDNNNDVIQAQQYNYKNKIDEQ